MKKSTKIVLGLLCAGAFLVPAQAQAQRDFSLKSQER